MPLYDFRCRACGETFEARAAVDELPPCPSCGAPDSERQVSSFAGPFRGGLRGAAAKRSNAQRSAREEQRRERRAERSEQRTERGDPPRGS
jgi:putative FmdB family regulatory protein